MMRIRIPATVMLALLAFGCGGENPADEATLQTSTAVSPAPPQGGAELDPDDPTILVRPFTTEQIRDEWVPGLRLLMRRTTPEGTRVERWTVIGADDEGVDIEYATISDDGTVDGEPPVERSTWIELRDHATFPAAQSTREWVARTTQLGDFEGWLYRVADASADTVQEFFFVPELPGAPVQMRILKGDTTIFELEQAARLRPETEEK
jgi:hypothetical protein